MMVLGLGHARSDAVETTRKLLALFMSSGEPTQAKTCTQHLQQCLACATAIMRVCLVLWLKIVSAVWLVYQTALLEAEAVSSESSTRDTSHGRRHAYLLVVLPLRQFRLKVGSPSKPHSRIRGE